MIVNNGLILIRGHSCDRAVMFRTGTVEYDVCIIIVIGIDVIVYIVASASFVIIIIISVVIFLSRYVVLIGLVFI